MHDLRLLKDFGDVINREFLYLTCRQLFTLLLQVGKHTVVNIKLTIVLTFWAQLDILKKKNTHNAFFAKLINSFWIRFFPFFINLCRLTIYIKEQLVYRMHCDILKTSVRDKYLQQGVYLFPFLNVYWISCFGR